MKHIKPYKLYESYESDPNKAICDTVLDIFQDLIDDNNEFKIECFTIGSNGPSPDKKLDIMLYISASKDNGSVYFGFNKVLVYIERVIDYMKSENRDINYIDARTLNDIKSIRANSLDELPIDKKYYDIGIGFKKDSFKPNQKLPTTWLRPLKNNLKNLDTKRYFENLESNDDILADLEDMSEDLRDEKFIVNISKVTHLNEFILRITSEWSNSFTMRKSLKDFLLRINKYAESVGLSVIYTSNHNNIYVYPDDDRGVRSNGNKMTDKWPTLSYISICLYRR